VGYIMKLAKFFEGKTVAITGSVGSVGRSLVDELLSMPVGSVRLVDNNESGLYEQHIAYREDGRTTPFLIDIADEAALVRAFLGADYVIHAAAFKHVPLCEIEPQSAVKNNIHGTQCVINAARTAQVKKVLFTSSDKAVNPTNFMGITKLAGERLITAANLHPGSGSTRFASTRFGNVLGSRGSVFPIFHNQIMTGQNITLTAADMTRFMMTNNDAVVHVLETLAMFEGGEIFVTKMPIFNIADFAEMMKICFSEAAGRAPESIEVDITGLRAGEKLYEELTTDEEAARTYEIEDFFVVLPIKEPYHKLFDYGRYSKTGKQVDRVYDSSREPALSIEDGINLLKKAGLV